MDNKDSKRGFSSLTNLTTDIGDSMPPQEPPIITENNANFEKKEINEANKRQASHKSNKTAIALFICIGLGILGSALSSLPSGSATNQARNSNNFAKSAPIATSLQTKQPVKTITASQIYNDILPVLPSAKTLNQNQVIIKGKLIVWDQTRNAVSAVQNQVPSELQWKNNYDGKTTVMVITGYSDKQVGTYGSNTPGYRRTANISLVTWPDKTAIGSVSILGEDPPPSIKYKGSKPSEVYGEINRPIANWVNNCQKMP